MCKIDFVFYLIKKNYLIFFVSLFFSVLSNAQELSSFNISSITQDQVAKANEILSNELTQNQIDIPNKILSNTISKDISQQSNEKESLGDAEVSDSNIIPDKKYGYDFISSSPTSISAVGDLPLPNEYRISINDQISVLLSGARDAIYELSVKLDGTILFPELGSVSVAGKTLGEVKDFLSALISKSYIGVQIDVSVKNLSAKKISIVGAVKTPGTYLVNPFSTITSALAYSGGVSEIGTLRNIKLKRISGEIFYFDLYKLLIKGDRTNDITIESGDVIVIDPASQFVKLSGEVIRPAIYEINEEENLIDLIGFGLGFTDIANKKKMSLEMLDLDSSRIKTINTDNPESSLSNILSVTIFPFNSKDENNINVIGAVKEPGYYDLSKFEYLDQLIDHLDFINVYPWLGVLEQFDENELIKSSKLFNLNDPETFNSIKLLPNSRIHFSDFKSISFNVDPLTRTLIEDYTLSLNHKGSSYNLPVIGKYNVDEFVKLLGLDMSDVDKEATYISPLDSLVEKKDYKLMSYIGKKYNTVIFRSPVNDLIRVNISGAIDYPGSYLLESNSSLKDLYNLVGNFKAESFFKGIIFTRESLRNRQLESIEKSKSDLREAIITSNQKGEFIGDLNTFLSLSESIDTKNLGRISGDFSPDSKSSENTILLDGDSIIVPKIPNALSVLGQVINPTAFEYLKGVSVSSAISSAGGYKDYADKGKVYVIKANGKILRQKRNILGKILTFGIFPRNVKLEPGDTVIVPRKIITNNPGLEALLPITSLLSNLAFTAAAIDSLDDN